jgi:hypothetical protein
MQFLVPRRSNAKGEVKDKERKRAKTKTGDSKVLGSLEEQTSIKLELCSTNTQRCRRHLYKPFTCERPLA